MPLAMRLILLFIVGAALARLANWFSWWLVRAYQPHAPRASSAAERRPQAGLTNNRFVTWLPVIGSWRARRKQVAATGPSGLRPLVVELTYGVAIAALYWWEIEHAGLLQALVPAGFVPGPADVLALHAEFFSQVILITFMLIASLVDVDEQIIPDLVTIPGTLLGLVIAAAWPIALLPIVAQLNGVPRVAFLTLASPNDSAAILAPAAQTTWLVVGLACYGLWCLALLPWRLRTRRGWGHAGRLLLGRWRRDPMAWLVLAAAVAGMAGILFIWWLGGERWLGLLSALAGMAAGGGLIWAVRIAAGWALGREAMGFGDVTLMAMIGGFLGWQAGPVVFFLAPVAGLAVGLVQWFAYRDNVVPYGPFLCLAALVVLLNWGPIWNWAIPLYGVAWLVPAALAVCLVLLAILLRLWRGIRAQLTRGR